MSISDKLKTIDNKIEKNKSRYSLDRQTSKISTWSSGNVSKYKFLTGRDVSLHKELLEKSTELKRFEYSLLDKELKTQTDIVKKQYQILDDTSGLDKIIKKEESTFINYNK